MNSRPLKLMESGGKTYEMWQEQQGVGNGDCILTKSKEGGNVGKYAMLFYDGLQTKPGEPMPENLNALKQKLYQKMPVFKIRYKPRDECNHIRALLENQMKISYEKYTI